LAQTAESDTGNLNAPGGERYLAHPARLFSLQQSIKIGIIKSDWTLAPRQDQAGS
jgi:hypothetical protein